MKTIQISCPGRLTLFFNINDINDNNMMYSSCNQMIDFYDVLNIKENRFYDKGLFINVLENQHDVDISDIYNACYLFFKYTGINYKHLSIDIKKNIPANSGLDDKNSLAVGTLLGLNDFYQTDLSGKELIDLSLKIDAYAPYFIFGDYAKVNNGYTEPLFNPYYKSFVLIMPRNKTEDDIESRVKKMSFEKTKYKNNVLYNCLYDLMPDDLKRLRDYLLKIKDLHHSLSGISNTYFIASHEEKIDNNLLLDINKNFPKFKLLIKKRITEYKYFRIYR